MTCWTGIIEKCLRDLQGRFPNLSQGQIADKLSIPRSTLNRLVNEGKKPQLDTLIKIVVGSDNSNLLQRAVSSLDNELGDSLRKIFEVSYSDKGTSHPSEELEKLLDDGDLLIVYLLTSLDNGTTREQVIEVLGNTGIELLNLLLKRNLVREESGKFNLIQKTRLIRSFESLKRHISTYAKHYKPSHVGKNRNYIQTTMDGLNEEGLKAIQEAHKELHRRTTEIFSNPKFKGDIPSFSVAFCDTFTSVTNKQEEGLQ